MQSPNTKVYILVLKLKIKNVKLFEVEDTNNIISRKYLWYYESNAWKKKTNPDDSIQLIYWNKASSFWGDPVYIRNSHLPIRSRPWKIMTIDKVYSSVSQVLSIP